MNATTMIRRTFGHAGYAVRGALVLQALCCAAPAGAQGAPAVPITLAEAQARAVEASHRLAEARARQAAAEGAVAVRVAADQPLLTASAGYTRTNHVAEFTVPSATGVPRVIYPDIPNNARTRIDLQWPIYTGGRADALERSARAEASAVAADVAAARGDLRLEVARAFWSLVTARATVTVLEQAVAREQAHLADVRQRLTVGLIPPNDVASSEAQESRQRMLLIEARNQRDMSSAELARLIGGDLSGPALEPAAVLDSAAPSSQMASALVVQAQASRNERKAIEQRIVAAEEQQVAARAGARPLVALVSGLDYARPNPRIFPRAGAWQESWDLGVQVSWAVWDWGRVRAETAQAASLTTAARQRLEEFDSQLALEIRQRQLEIDSGRAAIVAAQDGVRAATEAQRVVAERYKAGVATQTEVLDADFALLQAELDRTRAMAGVRFSEARLDRALGQ